MVKKHSSEAFYAFDDPLEAAIFSVWVEMMMEPGAGEEKCESLTPITTATVSSQEFLTKI